METLQKVLHPGSLFGAEKVVVVTGADKGIGYATVKGILKSQPNWTVYLTARNVTRGEAAVKRCQQEISRTPQFHQLDIEDSESIRRFRDHIRQNHKNGINVLVNNAGMGPIYPGARSAETKFEEEKRGYELEGKELGKEGRMEKEVLEAGKEVGGGKREERRGEEPRGHAEKEVLEAGKEVGASKKLGTHGEEEAKGEEYERFKFGPEAKQEPGKVVYDKEAYKAMIKSNYFGTLQVCQELFPLLGEDSTVIFVGSRLANLCFMKTRKDKQEMLRGCTKVEDCTKLMECLMNTDPEKLYSDKEDDKDAWLDQSPDFQLIPGYELGAIYPWAMSKLGLAILCRLYQLQFDSEKLSQNCHIVTCCPGLVKTDLNPLGVRTPEQGADTIVWTALLPKDSPMRGVVCGDRKMMDPFIVHEAEAVF